MVFFSPTLGLDGGRLAAVWWDTFDKSERERVQKFRFERDRCDYVAAHALLRVALGEIRGRSASLSLVDRSGWSLTHCAGFVACAVSADPSSQIGVDAEPLAAADRLASIQTVFVAPAEAEWLDAEPVDRATRLVELWTVKEAVLKSRGAGLTGPRGLAVLTEIDCQPSGTLDRWTQYEIHIGVEADAQWAWVTTSGGHVVATTEIGTKCPPELTYLPVLAEGLAP